MNVPTDHSVSPTDSRTSDERKQSPPAFLDLADSVGHFGPKVHYPSDTSPVFPLAQAARLGTNMPDISEVSHAPFDPLRVFEN